MDTLHINDSTLSEAKYIIVRQYYYYFINLYLLDDVFYEVLQFREENKFEKIKGQEDEKKFKL